MRRASSFPAFASAAVLALLCALAALKMTQSVDNDLFWQLKDGERVVTEGRWPILEDYSYTAAGKALVAHEWLAETLSYLVFKSAGYGGLVAANAGLFLAVFALLLALLRRRLPLGPSLSLLSLAAFAFLNFYGVRAQNWTFLFTALFLYWAALWEDGEERVPWAMAAALLPWANLHGGFMLGWGLLGLLCLRRCWEERRAAVLVPWGVGTVLCTLHPNGALAFVYPLWFMAFPPAARGMILEWRAVDLAETSALPYLLLLCALLWAGLSGLKRRFPWGALTLALAVLSLRGRKLLPEFAMAAVAALAFKAGPSGSRALRRALPAAGLLALAASAWVVLSRTRGLSLDFERAYPRTAAEMIAAKYTDRNLFHNYDWGGYLIYKLHPRARVFIDGRLDPYWTLLPGDYTTLIDLRPGWRELLDEYEITAALLRPTDRLGEALSRTPPWKLVYGGTGSVLFVR